MKTNFVALKEEDVKALKAMISETEKRTLDREFVLREIRKSLKATNSKLAGIIDANWKRFLELQALQMPHVVYNGKSTPTLVDWVKDPEGKFKLEKAIKAYRHTDDEAQTIVEGCFEGRITRSSVEPVKEVILALPATVEGDTTNFFIYKNIQDKVPVITTIARGIGVGEELEYADEATLGRSIMARTEFERAYNRNVE